eukprot:s519_g10.t1
MLDLVTTKAFKASHPPRFLADALVHPLPVRRRRFDSIGRLMLHSAQCFPQDLTAAHSRPNALAQHVVL